MNRLRKTALLFITLAMVFSCVVPSFAEEYCYFSKDYPVPKKFYNSSYYKYFCEDFRFTAPSDHDRYFSQIWFYNSDFPEAEVWPEIYLSKIEETIANASSLERCDYIDDFRINSTSWNNGVAYVDISVTFIVDRWFVEYPPLVWLGSTWEYDECLKLVATVRNKADGSTVELGLTGDRFEPELNINTYGSELSQFYSAEQAKKYFEENGIELDYTSECRKTVKIEMPEDFDPEKHSLELFFVDWRSMDNYVRRNMLFSEAAAIDASGYSKPEPVYSTGDVNTDGKVNLADAAIMLRYIADWDVSVNRDTADLNRDGLISLTDVQFILRRIAW